MKRTIRTLACATAIAALAACSHHRQANAPLAYVPADTPYLAANLKPMDADTRAALLKQADAQLPLQVAQMRHAAERLDKDNKPHMAALVRAVAGEFDGRTVEQAARHMGIDINGLYAMYGVGLSPVIRLQLSDPKAFEAFVGRLEKAWGTPLAKARVDSVEYRHTELADQVPVQLVVAVQKKQAVLALLPANADQELLGTVLGARRPKKSIADSGKFEKLIDDNGYLPQSAAFIDLRQLPALIAGEKDPLLNALAASDPGLAAKIPARCEADFSRMAARVPMISAGMTTLEADRMSERVNIDLAPDIAKAFSGIDVNLPGLGGDMTSPLDLAIALPVKELRSFWMAQADAVAAKPFTCPALTDMNQGFVKLRMAMQKTAMPGVNDLRGLRISLDRFDMPAKGQPATATKVTGRLMIASDNPAGLLAMAQMALPMLRDLQLNNDGKPVALPATLTRMANGQPAWAAMTGHVLAVAIGPGEDQGIADTLKQPSGAPGMMARFQMDGSIYRKWIDAMSGSMNAAMQHMAGQTRDPDTQAQAAAFQQNMARIKKQAENIDRISEKVHVDNSGLVVDIELKRH